MTLSRAAVITLSIIIVFLLSGCGGKKTAVQVPAPDPGRGKELVGIASWYGVRHHGRRTSNGEKYDRFAFTAAHRTLPFNSVVRVMNLQNGKSVKVRINDRGPFTRNCIIDLSYAAAKAIGMIESGRVKVRLELLQRVAN